MEAISINGVGSQESLGEQIVPIPASSETTLDKLCRGQRAIVKSLSCDNSQLRTKLLTMGLVEGVAVEVLGKAPLGDPMSIRVLRFQLSLRHSEAAHIRVVPC